MLFRHPRVLGIILDISLRNSNITGKKLLEDVRTELIKYIQTLEEEDGIYLYHDEVVDILYQRGEQIADLGNYETDGFRLDLSHALKQSLFVLGAADYDMEKTVVLISDHLKEENIYSIKKFISLNNKDDLGCKLVILNLGKKLDIGNVDVNYQEISSLDQSHLVKLFSEDL